MNGVRSLVGLCLIATLLAACGVAGSGGYAPVSQSGTDAAGARVRGAKGAASNLYVASWGYRAEHDSVRVYDSGSGKLLRTISEGVSAPIALAFDRSGNLYVANIGAHHGCLCGPSTVTVYAPGSSSPLRTISRGVDYLVAMAFDRLGNLYLASGSHVTVYAPGRSEVLRTVTAGLKSPQALAFDSSDNLYVADAPSNDVSVYAAESTSLLRTIDGVQGPTALAFDRSGNLYVGSQNIGPGKFGYGPGTIGVYAPGSASAIQSISTGTYGLHTLTFDGKGNLYAQGQVPNGASGGFVNGYFAGSLSLIRTIPERSLVPMAIVFDGSGNLYVANCPPCEGYPGPSRIRVYAHGATSPLRTIDASAPYALAFGP